MNEENEDFPKDQDERLERMFEAVRAHTPPTSEMSEAAKRVGASLPGSASAAGTQAFDSYEAMIPDYLAGRLSEAQVLLFEEETRRSIPLRRALQSARTDHTATDRESVSQPGRELQRGRRLPWRWVAGVSVAASVGLLFTLIVLPRMPAADQSRLARVETVDGKLFHVTDTGLSAIVPGDWISGQESIRTAKGSIAVIKLDDGSRLEIGERSQIATVRHRAGNRVSVDRGRIIVQAAPRESGTLDVATDELDVSVTGTVFGVSHGARGSRVSVIEGEVQVAHAGVRRSMLAGEQLATRPTLVMVALEDEISWSQDAETYLEMLQALDGLRRDLGEAMTVEPRYSTRLLDLAPARTVAFGSIPNAAAKAVEVYQLVRRRMWSTDATREQWRQFEASDNYADVEDLFELARRDSGRPRRGNRAGDPSGFHPCPCAVGWRRKAHTGGSLGSEWRGHPICSARQDRRARITHGSGRGR